MTKTRVASFCSWRAGVFLSFQLSHSLDLELRTDDSLWRGPSFRGDVKVMLPGEARTFRHKRPARFAHVTVPKPLLASLDGDLQRLRPHVILSDVPLRHLGEPPHRYQTRRRVERARELLHEGESPVVAALAVGFCDQSHLARHMRRVTGHSPGHWERISADRSPRRQNVL